MEQHTNALPMMDPSNRLSKHKAHLEHLKLISKQPLMRCLINAVRHDNSVQCAGFDPLDRIAAEDAVCDEGIDLGGSLFLEQFRRAGDGVARVGHVVDEDGRAVGYVSDEHHGGILALVDLRWPALLLCIRWTPALEG